MLKPAKNSHGNAYRSGDLALLTLAHMLTDLGTQDRSSFLQFCTSSSRLVPGQDLKITVLPQYPANKLQPYGHTCSYTLDLPDYYTVSEDPYVLAWSDCHHHGDPRVLEAWDNARIAAAAAFPDAPIPGTCPPDVGAEATAWEEWAESEKRHSKHKSVKECANIEELLKLYRGDGVPNDAKKPVLSPFANDAKAGEASQEEVSAEKSCVKAGPALSIDEIEVGTLVTTTDESDIIRMAIMENPAYGQCEFDEKIILEQSGVQGVVTDVVERHRNVRVRFNSEGEGIWIPVEGLLLWGTQRGSTNTRDTGDSPRFRYSVAIARFFFVAAFDQMLSGGFVERGHA